MKKELFLIMFLSLYYNLSKKIVICFVTKFKLAEMRRDKASVVRVQETCHNVVPCFLPGATTAICAGFFFKGLM